MIRKILAHIITTTMLFTSLNIYANTETSVDLTEANAACETYVSLGCDDDAESDSKCGELKATCDSGTQAIQNVTKEEGINDGVGSTNLELTYASLVIGMMVMTYTLGPACSDQPSAIIGSVISGGWILGELFFVDTYSIKSESTKKMLKTYFIDNKVEKDLQIKTLELIENEYTALIKIMEKKLIWGKALASILTLGAILSLLESFDKTKKYGLCKGKAKGEVFYTPSIENYQRYSKYTEKKQLLENLYRMFSLATQEAQAGETINKHGSSNFRKFTALLGAGTAGSLFFTKMTNFYKKVGEKIFKTPAGRIIFFGTMGSLTATYLVQTKKLKEKLEERKSEITELITKLETDSTTTTATIEDITLNANSSFSIADLFDLEPDSIFPSSSSVIAADTTGCIASGSCTSDFNANQLSGFRTNSGRVLGKSNGDKLTASTYKYANKGNLENLSGINAIANKTDKVKLDKTLAELKDKYNEKRKADGKEEIDFDGQTKAMVSSISKNFSNQGLVSPFSSSLTTDVAEKLSKSLPKDIAQKITTISQPTSQISALDNIFGNDLPEVDINKNTQQMAQAELKKSKMIQDDSDINSKDEIIWEKIHLRYLNKYNEFFNQKGRIK